MWPNAIPVLAYDTARVLAEGLHRAPVLTGSGLKAGLEQIRFMPSTTGGPHTHIAGGPYDHQLFKGDWLLYGRIRTARSSSKGCSSRSSDAGAYRRALGGSSLRRHDDSDPSSDAGAGEEEAQPRPDLDRRGCGGDRDHRRRRLEDVEQLAARAGRRRQSRPRRSTRRGRPGTRTAPPRSRRLRRSRRSSRSRRARPAGSCSASATRPGPPRCPRSACGTGPVASSR